MQQIFQQYQDHVVDPQTQQRLGQPLHDPTGFNEGHEEFLNMLIAKIESGELNPHDLKTLYNSAVYNQLSEEDQEKADLTGHNIMSVIRQIEALWKMEQKATFQVQNLVETVFQMKSKFEEEYGDVYVI